MSRDDDPVVMQWLGSQAAKGAIVIGVCAGAKVVAAAGLLEDERATTHWYFLDELRNAHRSIRYVADRRFVADQGVVTTTGITASMPMTLTLIESIAGKRKAQAVGRELGLVSWDARHDSDAFGVTRPFAMTVMRNRLAFWNHERLGIEVSSGVDEVSLAFVADAWSRTYRSSVRTFARTSGALDTAGGLRLLPDEVSTDWPASRRIGGLDGNGSANILDEALAEITKRYRTDTADVVAMQLEYPGRSVSR